MRLRTILVYLWKIPLCGLLFVLGLVLGNPLIAVLNMELPAMPAGTDPNTIMIWMVAGSLLVAFVLSFVARGIQGRFFVRWLILFALTWGGSAVNMVIEATLFTTGGAVASTGTMLTTMVLYFLPSLLVAAALALLFPPIQLGVGLVANLRTFFARRSAASWAWRLPVAVVAFPIIYFTFGMLVQPLVEDVYAQGLYEMRAPTWAELIPVQLLRGVLFLAISLPVLATWQHARRRLIGALGMAIFILLAFMSVLTAYWLPLTFRIVHAFEILADSLIYAWAVVYVLGVGVKKEQRLEEAVPAQPRSPIRA